MSSLLLVLFSLTLRPITSLDALMLRWEIASGIVEATEDAFTQRLLMATANEESQFRRDACDCRVYGDHGRSAGPFQTSFVNDGQRWGICHYPAVAAAVALERLRESAEMCRWLPVAEQGAGYAAGRCDSQMGRAISRRRWALAVGWMR